MRSAWAFGLVIKALIKMPVSHIGVFKIHLFFPSEHWATVPNSNFKLQLPANVDPGR